LCKRILDELYTQTVYVLTLVCLVSIETWARTWTKRYIFIHLYSWSSLWHEKWYW